MTSFLFPILDPLSSLPVERRYLSSQVTLFGNVHLDSDIIASNLISNHPSPNGLSFLTTLVVDYKTGPVDRLALVEDPSHKDTKVRLLHALAAIDPTTPVFKMFCSAPTYKTAASALRSESKLSEEQSQAKELNLRLWSSSNTNPDWEARIRAELTGAATSSNQPPPQPNQQYGEGYNSAPAPDRREDSGLAAGGRGGGGGGGGQRDSSHHLIRGGGPDTGPAAGGHGNSRDNAQFYSAPQPPARAADVFTPASKFVQATGGGGPTTDGGGPDVGASGRDKRKITQVKMSDAADKASQKQPPTAPSGGEPDSSPASAPSPDCKRFLFASTTVDNAASADKTDVSVEDIDVSDAETTASDDATIIDDTASAATIVGETASVPTNVDSEPSPDLLQWTEVPTNSSAKPSSPPASARSPDAFTTRNKFEIFNQVDNKEKTDTKNETKGKTSSQAASANTSDPE